ncbi:cytochrome c biogenesis protein CcsA [Zhouia sp. PK063]|uniref:cytochrome c biogenesis protein CcsA n=1 Tax=Zhouia sp. PK063 TaxID=3373602 RepID=UPI00379A2914
MIDTIKKILFSTRLMAILFIVFAVSMAMGTFIENEYSTNTARIWVYNTIWFQVILVFFVINFCGNIKKYKLWRREKIAVLLLHLSFILIILGAFITRYFGYEGVMPIREGNTESTYYSDKVFLTVNVDGDINGEPRRKTLQTGILASEQGEMAYLPFHNLPWNNDFNGKPFSVEYIGFIEGAEKGLVPDEKGEDYLKLVEAGNGTRHEHYIKSGQVVSIHNILFALNKETPGAININTQDSTYTMTSGFEGDFMRMADQFRGKVAKDSLQPLMLRSLYNVAGIQFVIPDRIVRGDYQVIPAANKKQASQDAFIVKVTSGSESKEVKILGGKGTTAEPTEIKLNGLTFNLTYGSNPLKLPFSIKLNDFVAQRYPGTEKGYSSFMSKITVNDEKPFDYDIYMNHILDYKGYRFFQSQFDPDEKGTILSVNHDFWGTTITYIGYFLLYAGLMGIMFYGKTRFKDLGVMLEKVKAKKAKMFTMIALLVGFQSFSQVDTNRDETKQAPQEHVHTTVTDSLPTEDDHVHDMAPPTEAQVDSAIEATKVSKAHAEKFGKLVIQDNGRMKPINTFASELLRKISKKEAYKDMNADQVFLSMMQNPAAWYNVPFFYLKKHNDSLHDIIGVQKNVEYVRAIDFFDNQGNYKLSPYLEEAYAAAVPNQFQKDFKDIDLRLGLLNQALGGDILKIFPLLHDDNNKWISSVDYSSGNYQVQDSLYANFIKKSIPFYLMTLQDAESSGDYTNADNLLEAFHKNQEKNGAEVLPSDRKVNIEIIYNRVNIFQRLLLYYLFAGMILFTLIIIQIFNDNKVLRTLIKVMKYVILILFIAHTVGLVTRSYLSGHAPWSDAYESMIYVAWATMGIGLLFTKKSDITIASTAFVASLILFGAHLNWLDPSIANLQPVLDSYWLMIHVAIIVASYGPFTLGMILGVVTLLLFILTTPKNKARMDINIKEITIIMELALTVGLVMLTIGTFLGGQWANESWGRYWGWDPKETWALISSLVYAFVIHMRLVPALRGRFAFSFASVIAYASIMMTYFGVNFYLSGLHSYASGDKVITPDFVIYTVIGVFILGAISYWRYTINYKKVK